MAADIAGYKLTGMFSELLQKDNWIKPVTIIIKSYNTL